LLGIKISEESKTHTDGPSAGSTQPDRHRGASRVLLAPILTQHAGLQWLYMLTQLKLGVCLADDMGLGKTIQVLSLLLVLKDEAGEERKPCLLVAPASLLANCQRRLPGCAKLQCCRRSSIRDPR
jgi:SNF2 family DNA or RNA helicase